MMTLRDGGIETVLRLRQCRATDCGGSFRVPAVLVIAASAIAATNVSNGHVGRNGGPPIADTGIPPEVGSFTVCVNVHIACADTGFA